MLDNGWRRNRKTGGWFNIYDKQMTTNDYMNNIIRTKSSTPKRPKTIEEWQSYFQEQYDNNIVLNDNLKEIESDVLNTQLEQFEKLYNKYDLNGKKFTIDCTDKKSYVAQYDQDMEIIHLSKYYFEDTNFLRKNLEEGIKSNYYSAIKKENYDKYFISHEMGHILEIKLIREYGFSEKFGDEHFKNLMYSNINAKTGKTREQIDKEFISNQVSQGRDGHYEWFAEGFTQYELGEINIFNNEIYNLIRG